MEFVSINGVKYIRPENLKITFPEVDPFLTELGEILNIYIQPSEKNVVLTIKNEIKIKARKYVQDSINLSWTQYPDRSGR